MVALLERMTEHGGHVQLPPTGDWWRYRGAADSALDLNRFPLSDLVAEFLTETPPLVQALQTAVEDGDPAGALHAAHMLKGLSATFGATAMARLCQRVESHSAEPSPGMSSPLVAEIAAEHERVTVALRQLV